MKRPVLLLLGVLLAASNLLCSCGPADYVGTYVGHHPFGLDTLVLRPDSTYYHSFRSLKGQQYTHGGKWSGWSLKEFDRIDIQNFDWHLPGFGTESEHDTINSTWPAQLDHRGWGDECIWLDEDLNYYYLKIR